LQNLNVERILKQQRRRGITEPQAEPAVVLPKLPLPDLVAREVETVQMAVGVEHIDALTVGNGRGRRRIMLVEPDVLAAQQTLPDEAAILLVHAPEIELLAVRDVEKYPLAPDHRRGRAQPGQLQPPRDILLPAPAQRQILLIAHTVEQRAAPLRPV